MANEHGRNAAVQSYGVLDTGAEDTFDALATLARDVCGTPIALITVLHEDRQWHKSHIGLDVSGVAREDSFCTHAIQTPDDLFEVEDARADPRFFQNPLVTGEPHIRFYAGMPLRSSDGYAIGALCVIDREARTLDDNHRAALRTLAKQVEAQFELRRYALESLPGAFPIAPPASDHDALTGLPSNALLEARLDRALARAKAGAGGAAVLSLDLDRFAAVNGSLGRDAGDRLLAAVASRLQRQLRPCDFLARVRSDQFAIVLEGIGSGRIAEMFARRLLASFELPFAVGSYGDVFMAASVGVVVVDPRFATVADVSRAAEIAMGRAKALGKHRFHTVDREAYARALDDFQLEKDVREALARDEFELAYQPIVELESGELTGFEALLRWRHPTRGLVMPDAFVPVVERTGDIVAIGEWVIDEADRHAVAWHAAHPDVDLTIAVNISAKQLADTKLLANVRRRFDGRPPHLRFEITESALIADVDASVLTLQALRLLGVSVDLDDFGTGYSSLAYLHRLPVDALKIDRTFVGPGPGLANEAIVRTIVALAATLGLETIAEGIETADQFATLRELGCTSGQGYYIARPLDGTAARAFLDRAARVGA